MKTELIITQKPLFRTADEGLNYVETRMESLRQTLLQRNDEKAKLEWALFKYQFLFWSLVALNIGVLGALILGVLFG